MSKREYQQKQRARDIHEQHKIKGEKVEIPLDEIFFILTRDGVDAFNAMFENTLRNVVREEVNRSLRSVAAGIREGFTNMMTGSVDSMVEEELDNLDEHLEERAEIQQSGADTDGDYVDISGMYPKTELPEEPKT